LTISGTRPWYVSSLDAAMSTASVAVTGTAVAPYIYLTLTGIAATIKWGGSVSLSITSSL
jgi:hypothetical protein